MEEGLDLFEGPVMATILPRQKATMEALRLFLAGNVVEVDRNAEIEVTENIRVQIDQRISIRIRKFEQENAVAKTDNSSKASEENPDES